ncbi:MAG TPA: S53 family peptidase [Ktedonobacterales bacterium]
MRARRTVRRMRWWLLPLIMTLLVGSTAVGLLSGVATADHFGREAAALTAATAAASPAASATPGPPGRGAPLPPPGQTLAGKYLMTPDELRAAYNVTPLLEMGLSGAGQTVVVIVSFGSPTLQQDVATFCQRYGLPPAQLSVLAPLGTTAFDENDPSMAAWARETEEDVEVIHAIAPGAKIVVLTSPVDETQGTHGLPQFRQLEQYAVEHHLGSVISQSWGASEATLNDPAGRAEVEQWDVFFQRATTQQGITFLAASGDHGATDWGDAAMSRFSAAPTTTFPASNPWVTAVGGTTLTRGPSAFQETAWSGSGGGYSNLFLAPSYQQAKPFAGRGVPDIAAAADRATGLGIYVRGEWRVAVGTSASTPFWAALTAIANQMAGRPLGFLNPALYALAQEKRNAGDFYDITSGNNSYSGHGVSVAGYPAGRGWDAVTGLGTPNAARLLPDLIETQLAPAPR